MDGIETIFGNDSPQVHAFCQRLKAQEGDEQARSLLTRAGHAADWEVFFGSTDDQVAAEVQLPGSRWAEPGEDFFAEFVGVNGHDEDPLAANHVVAVDVAAATSVDDVVAALDDGDQGYADGASAAHFIRIEATDTVALRRFDAVELATAILTATSESFNAARGKLRACQARDLLAAIDRAETELLRLRRQAHEDLLTDVGLFATSFDLLSPEDQS